MIRPPNVWDISTEKQTCFNSPIWWRKNEAEQIVQQASGKCLSQFSVQRIEQPTREQIFLKSIQTTWEDLIQIVKKEIVFH